MRQYDVSPLSNKSGASPVKIKGLYYRRETLMRMSKMYRTPDNRFTVPVSIVPEPDNPYDRFALSVRWQGKPIGYIPAEINREYQQIRRVTASGYEATTSAHLHSYLDVDGLQQFGGTIDLPAPANLVPLNDPPHDGYTVLPIGDAIQVTKEADHLDVLLDYIPNEGQGHLLVSLHTFQARTKTKWQCVEVCLDGRKIGELTKASSEKFSPTINHFDDLGLTTLCHAVIKGSSISAEVTLFAAKAHELSERDLSPVNFSSIPKLCDYEADPSKYIVPNAFSRAQRSPKFAHVKPVTFTEEEKAAESARRQSTTPAPQKGCGTGVFLAASVLVALFIILI